MEPTPTPISLPLPPIPELPKLTLKNFWEITAFLGIFADVFAIISIIGSTLILLIGIINFIFKKRILHTTEDMAQWSIIGLFVGIPIIYAVFITNSKFVGLIIHDKISIALLLLASFLMLLLRITIEVIKKLTQN